MTTKTEIVKQLRAKLKRITLSEIADKVKINENGDVLDVTLDIRISTKIPIENAN